MAPTDRCSRGVCTARTSFSIEPAARPSACRFACASTLDPHSHRGDLCRPCTLLDIAVLLPATVRRRFVQDLPSLHPCCLVSRRKINISPPSMQRVLRDATVLERSCGARAPPCVKYPLYNGPFLLSRRRSANLWADESRCVHCVLFWNVDFRAARSLGPATAASRHICPVPHTVWMSRLLSETLSLLGMAMRRRSRRGRSM